MPQDDFLTDLTGLYISFVSVQTTKRLQDEVFSTHPVENVPSCDKSLKSSWAVGINMTCYVCGQKAD